MLKGEYYNGFEEGLLNDRKKAKKLCQQLNNIPDGSQTERS
ncbi:MAG: maltose acetyltransferase domain-containing protein, partial [Crocosphaera sp.]|nr:maltose acetyltransferase domain-containing protein [Crocosphaera sp.]